MLRAILIMSSLLLTSSTISLAEDTDDGVYEITENCGETKVVLSCVPRNKDCQKVNFSFFLVGEKEKKISGYEEMEKQQIFPMGLKCYTYNQKNYIVLHYDALYIGGCKYCELFDLYDDRGNLLTKKSSILLKHKDGEGHPAYRSYPNNELFYDLAKEIGLDASIGMTDNFKYIYVPISD